MSKEKKEIHGHTDYNLFFFVDPNVLGVRCQLMVVVNLLGQGIICRYLIWRVLR